MNKLVYEALLDVDGGVVVTGMRDGGTFKVALDAAPEVAYLPWLRLAGVDCPEKATDAGKAARAHVFNLLRNAGAASVRSEGRRSFDRLVADVWLDGQHLATELVQDGFAVYWTRSRYAHFGVEPPRWVAA